MNSLHWMLIWAIYFLIGGPWNHTVIMFQNILSCIVDVLIWDVIIFCVLVRCLVVCTCRCNLSPSLFSQADLIQVSFEPSAARIPIGGYENVTVTARDTSGNSAQCHFQVRTGDVLLERGGAWTLSENGSGSNSWGIVGSNQWNGMGLCHGDWNWLFRYGLTFQIWMIQKISVNIGRWASEHQWLFCQAFHDIQSLAIGYDSYHTGVYINIV